MFSFITAFGGTSVSGSGHLLLALPLAGGMSLSGQAMIDSSIITLLATGGISILEEATAIRFTMVRLIGTHGRSVTLIGDESQNNPVALL